MPSAGVLTTTDARTWLRVSGALTVVTALMWLFHGCGTCNNAECSGRVELHLVDEQGQQAAARLRHRSNQSSNIVYFDCSGESSSTSTSLPTSPRGVCQDGIAFLEQPYFDRAELKYEVAFLLPDGQWTDWQTIPLMGEEKTVDDFNGPGCDCTFKQGKTPPVEVPIEAQIPTQ